MSVEVRAAESDADLEGWIRVKRAVFPNESAWTVQEFRERREPKSLVLVAELEGEIVGAGSGALRTSRAAGSSLRASTRTRAAAVSAARCSTG